MIWNSLPLSVQELSNTECLKHHLKTVLFSDVLALVLVLISFCSIPV